MPRNGKTLGGLNIHRDASATKSARSENLKQIAEARRAIGLVRDLGGVRAPIAARRAAIIEIKALALDIAAGRLSLAEARAQLRGAA